MRNTSGLKPFKAGDPRINRKGRPKSFDALRELAQEIAVEPAKNADGHTIVINDKIVTKIEAALRVMLTDKKLFALFLEYAYGKPKVELEHSGPGGGPIVSAVRQVDNVDELRQFIEAVKESGLDFTRAETDEIHPAPSDA